MDITRETINEINGDLLALLGQAAEAHMKNHRTASVTLRLTIKLDPKTLKRELRGRVTASLPKGVADSVQRKLDPVLLLRHDDSIPGQQKIG